MKNMHSKNTRKKSSKKTHSAESPIKVTKAPKSPSESSVTMTELVLPTHTNALGTIFGGTVMSWVDIAAAIAATRHSRGNVVTASIDALHFIAPIKIGHVVVLKASVNFASRTSMEVGVRVDSENPHTGQTRHNATAYLTFVALDEDGRPTEVPQILPSTALEKARYERAVKRRASRIKLALELKKER